ncbi:hypothetical protein AVEN_134581-1 [Araneus ventricosus]|uniref:Uncharacterized protein n=1 Tax=Araneus ventricosus TaxID=182803 RepID=A0A4Y2GGE7_ARAVE|nr:hypothetical protein AVEN_134581-1 [Araneus ventricosus]
MIKFQTIPWMLLKDVSSSQGTIVGSDDGNERDDADGHIFHGRNGSAPGGLQREQGIIPTASMRASSHSTERDEFSPLPPRSLLSRLTNES